MEVCIHPVNWFNASITSTLEITQIPVHTTSKDNRAQSTVDFPIGGHVNVLSDYKETGPEKNSKF